MRRGSEMTVALAGQDGCRNGLRTAGRIPQHRVEHRLEFAGRTGDDVEHLAGRGLLLQRFGEIVGALAQLAEQPRVLDGDDGLRGEVLDQLNLLVGERADFLAIDDDRADHVVVLQHRHLHAFARREARRCRGGVLAIGVAARTCDDWRPAGSLARDRRRGSSREMAGARSRYSAEPGGSLLPRVAMAVVAIHVAEQVAEFRVADARGVLQHRLEHRLAARPASWR